MKRHPPRWRAEQFHLRCVRTVEQDANVTPAQQLSKEIQERFRQMIEAHSVPVLSCWAFGLMCDQSFWVSVKTDKERDRLLGDANLLARMHAVFQDTGYRAMAEDIWKGKNVSKTFFITIESQETVDRSYKGNWYYRTK